jgi:large subunit ribosomal protein L29
MKRRDIKALHEQTIDELRKSLRDAREELYTLRLDKVQFKLKNTSSLRVKRDDIARLQTVLKQKEVTK